MASEPLHSTVAADLRRSISEGKYEPGQALPSEAQLEAKYGVSRVTVRRALLTLEQEGLVAARAGRGRVVRERRDMVYRPQADEEPRRSKTMDRFMASLTEEGRKPTQSIEVQIESADKLVADRYGVPQGTSMAVRKRVRSIDGEPFNINDTYYLLDMVKDTPIMSPTDIPEGSNAVITRLIGREVRALDEYYIRMPKPEESERLALSTGTPVAVHYLTGFTADDHISRVEKYVLPGDRHIIVYEREHPSQDDTT
ncbi:GntR family transcriptional regulator [Actinophytocola sediminis]